MEWITTPNLVILSAVKDPLLHPNRPTPPYPCHPERSEGPPAPPERNTISHSNPTIDELAAHCFGCGPANPQGLHLHFNLILTDPAHPVAQATVHLTELHQGPPGHIHGGIVATLCDEAMSKLNRPLNLLAMTRHLEVDYLRPAPLHTPLLLTARHLHREGRKLFHTVELHHPSGDILARGKGLFIVVDPRHLTPGSKSQPDL